MKVYTYQDIRAYLEALKTGYLRANVKYIEPYFLDAYYYMVEQMQERIGYDTNEYPIWVWAEPQEIEHFHSDVMIVCLEMEIPDDKILWSNFCAWHSVLNRGYCAITDEDSDWFDEVCRTTPKETSSIIIDSWSRIYEAETHEIFQGDLQGCTGAVPSSSIRLIDYKVSDSFTSK